MAEQPVWTGRSSQIKNLGTFIACGLFELGIIAGGIFFPPALIALVIPTVIFAWAWISLHHREYELTTERLITKAGVFSRNIESLELYRVRDIRVQQPLFERLFKLETVAVVTTDPSTPHVTITHIPIAAELPKKIRDHVESCRMAKGTRELGIESAPAPDWQNP